MKEKDFLNLHKVELQRVQQMDKQEYVKRFNTAKRNLYPMRAPNNFVETEFYKIPDKKSPEPNRKAKSPSRFVASNLTPSKYLKPPPRMPFSIP